MESDATVIAADEDQVYGTWPKLQDLGFETHDQGSSEVRVAVQNVTNGSWASRGGLKTGDILVELNKIKLENSQQLIVRFSKLHWGDDLAFFVVRDGESMLVGARLPESRSAAQSLLHKATPEGDNSLSLGDIAGEIEKIRRGPHESMPPAEASPGGIGEPSLTVENGTKYTLTILLSGPTSQKLQIVPGGSQSISIIPGSYEMAARVSDPNVIAFYGNESFDIGSKYSENFYISTRIH